MMLIIPVLALSGCLSRETPCNFFKIYQRELYNSVWNIDSLHVFVFNNGTQFIRDTSYTNYGTLKFVSNDQYNCNDTGRVEITTANNALIQMNYSMAIQNNSYYGGGNGYNFNQVCIQSSVPLDGYPAPYYLCSIDSITPGHIKIFGNPSVPYATDSVIRYWEFFLTAK